MTCDRFVVWRKRLGFRSAAAIAPHLGVSEWTVRNWERGYRSDNKQPVEIPVTVAWAIAGMANGGKPAE